MNAPHIVVSNVVHGEGSIVYSCDLRVEVAPDLVLVIRGAKLIANRAGGHFVGLPRRSQGAEEWFDIVSLEGDAAKAVYTTIRNAMNEQLAKASELKAEEPNDAPF